MNKQNLHYNVPQLRSAIVDAPFETFIAGRGTGKTEGVIATKSIKRLDTMRRCRGVFQGATFQQLLTRTLPPVIKGWEKLGYKLGVHYLIGQKPPDKWKRMWKWEGPYQLPLKYDYFISWWSGSGISLLSQDNIGSANGISIDWIMGDEAKLLNHDRLKDELYPANRGLIKAFANDPHHHGITFTSDMPVGTSGRWLLDQAENSDNEKVNELMKLDASLQFIRSVLAGDCSESERKKLLKDYATIEAIMNHLRQDLVFYHEASTLDNIDGLGVQFIRQLMRDMDDFTFNTTILNRKPRKIDDGFYPDLNEEKHGYFDYDYHAFEKRGYDFEALSNAGAEWDADYDSNKVLHIAIDNNRRLTPMVVAQRVNGFEIRGINSFWSEPPYKIQDTVDKFCEYYKFHQKRVVYFWYDHTLIAEFGHSGSASDEVIRRLRYHDFIVIPRYIGQAIGHSKRYSMWGHLLSEDGYYPFTFRYNRDKCEHWINSMFLTPAVKVKDGFGKDKSAEKDPKFPALDAPHFGEAGDMLVSGICESGLVWEDDNYNDEMSMDLI